MTGIGFFIAFAAIASGSTSVLVMIASYIAIAWIWGWHTVVLLDLRRLHRSRSAREAHGG